VNQIEFGYWIKGIAAALKGEPPSRELWQEIVSAASRPTPNLTPYDQLAEQHRVKQNEPKYDPVKPSPWNERPPVQLPTPWQPMPVTCGALK
jgi:hypothetical protein